ncbi:MAG: exosome complex RNA-binding protein Rrp4 [Nanoarchaeota archaeon]|nr:exosome complex RNA-binding protein Rrp4 [Nanoarchaeota archaeon]
MEERKIVVPGETIVTGEDFLPGDGTRRENDDIVAGKFGLSDISDRLVKVIPLSGVYIPRRGNTVIGQIVDITFNGWLIDFNGPANGFLSLSEIPRYISKDEMRDYLDFGDVVIARIWNAKGKGIDLTLKVRGLGQLEGGMLMKINPNKVPRVIGKEGSMVNLIKEATNCEVTVGQNGMVWIKGNEIDKELRAKEIIEFICKNSFVEGLTEMVKEFIDGGVKK